jgi:hypothetical protein
VEEKTTGRSEMPFLSKSVKSLSSKARRERSKTTRRTDIKSRYGCC